MGGLCPEDADAGGGVDFVAGEDEEIGVELLDVDVEMGHGLGGVDEGEGVIFFRGGDHFRDWVDGAKGVGNPGEGEDFCFRGEQCREGMLVEDAVVITGDDGDFGVVALGEHLPWDDVGVVFEGGDEDFVAG